MVRGCHGPCDHLIVVIRITRKCLSASDLPSLSSPLKHRTNVRRRRVLVLAQTEALPIESRWGTLVSNGPGEVGD